MWIPGSIGNVYWVPQKAGSQSNIQYTTMDSSLLLELRGITDAANSAFEGAKGAYEPDRLDYNKKVADEAARLKDFFKAGFEPAIKIPTRPCPPSRPAAYAGPQLRLAKKDDDTTDLLSFVNG